MKTSLELAQLFQELPSWDTAGTDTQYKLLQYPDETVIIFGASNSKKDWKINFSFPKKPYKRMETPFFVHGGFLKEWQKIHDIFLAYFEMGLDFKPVTVVGWSYGGAIATLCAEDLWYNFPWMRNTLKLVTFGAPRTVGFFGFSRVSERWDCATPYTNNTDIVTMLPPVVLGFRHVARQTHIGKRRTILGLFKPRKSHDISCYTQSLGACHGQ